MMMIALAAALLGQAAVPPPRISHEAIGPGRYRLHLESQGISTVEEGQLQLLPDAQRLCGAEPAYLGDYTFSANEQVARGSRARAPVSLVLDQEISCGAPPPVLEEGAAPGPVAGWRPGPAEEQSVFAATRAYFAARDNSRFAQAYAMLTLGNRATVEFARWSREAAASNARGGALRGRTLLRVTWYENPPSAPPGIYGAVDFNADFAGLHFLCGYLMWLRQPDGSWRLVREEQSSASRDEGDVTPERLAEFRAQVGCRD